MPLSIQILRNYNRDIRESENPKTIIIKKNTIPKENQFSFTLCSVKNKKLFIQNALFFG